MKEKKKVFKILHENKLSQFPFNLSLNGGNSCKQILGAKKQYKFQLKVTFFINIHFLHERNVHNELKYEKKSNLLKLHLFASKLGG